MHPTDTPTAAFDSAPDATASTAVRRIVFISGLSGAGMSSALKNMEDFGFEVFDNFPLGFIDALIDDTDAGHKSVPIAIGLDTRTRGFSPQDLVKKIDALAARDDLDVMLCFLSCDDETIYKRYSETRRPHPLAKDSPIADGIALEKNWLQPLLKRADLVIDTTGLSVHDLKRLLGSNFSPQAEGKKIYVTVMSFGFKNGLPREADMVIDVRFLQNPHWEKKLRPLTGQDTPVQDYIRKDEGFDPLNRHISSLLELLLPRYEVEGKSYFTLAVGCTGGRHRSVYMAELWAEMVKTLGFAVSLRHRDLD